MDQTRRDIQEIMDRTVRSSSCAREAWDAYMGENQGNEVRAKLRELARNLLESLSYIERIREREEG